MKCKRCGEEKVLVDGLLEGKMKVVCRKCGFQEIRDNEGRQMLTDDMPQPDRSKYLTEA